MQKYIAMAMMVGTRWAQAAPTKLVRSPANQIRIKGMDIASAEPQR